MGGELCPSASAFADTVRLAPADCRGHVSAIPIPEIAYRVLRLEQQLESYQRLHAEELEQIRRALHELKAQVLALAEQKLEPAEPGGEPDG